MKRNEYPVVKMEILTIVGLIMVFVPLNSALVLFIFSLFHENHVPVESLADGPTTVVLQSTAPEGLPFIGLMVFVCGLIILGFIGFRLLRRKNAVRNENN